MPKSIAEFIARAARKIPLVLNRYHYHEIKKIVRIFTKTDFTLTKSKNFHYKLTFSNVFGYAGELSSLTFFYSYFRLAWKITIGKVNFYVRQNPVFELINELRGYTLLGKPQRKDFVIDVGSGNGMIACYFAQLVGPRGRVFALEPDPRALIVLEENITLNRLSNITVISKGLYSGGGERLLSIGEVGAASIESIPGKANQKNVTIDVINFTNLVERYAIEPQKISLIKLDIEGAELEVLPDLFKLVQQFPKIVVAIAAYHQRNSRETWELIQKRAGKYSSIFVKTLYPYHTTSFIINKTNKSAIKKLKELPSFQKMNSIIWAT